MDCVTCAHVPIIIHYRILLLLEEEEEKKEKTSLDPSPLRRNASCFSTKIIIRKTKAFEKMEGLWPQQLASNQQWMRARRTQKKKIKED